MFLVLEHLITCGQTRKHSFLPKSLVFLNIFASWEVNFVVTTMFPEVGQTEKH